MAELRWLCFALLAAVAPAQEDEEGRSVLLLYKKMEPMENIEVGRHINVTLSVFNKGLGNAYSLVVNDDNWKSDKFHIVAGGNNFTLDYLNLATNTYTNSLSCRSRRRGTVYGLRRWRSSMALRARTP